MKPLFILLTTVFSYFANAANTPETIAPAAIKAFAQKFSNASMVSWTISGDLYQARFQIAGRYANAYYDENVKLVVVTRYISLSELPIVLQAKIKDKYPQHQTSELLEATDDNGTSYYVALENASQKIILKSYGTKSWSMYQKIKK